MLVLTRKLGEQIIIDDRVVVTVLSINGERVRLGVEAPRTVQVDRLEIYNRRLINPAGPEQADLVATGS